TAFHHTDPPVTYTLSLHDALPISCSVQRRSGTKPTAMPRPRGCPGHRCSGPKGQRVQAAVACPSRTLRKLPSDYLDILAAEASRSEEHTSELQSLAYLVCRLLLEK